MMKVMVNREVRTLSLVDANGTDWTADFVGNWNGFGEIVPDGEGGYTATEYAFSWWEIAVERQAENDAKKAELVEKFGSDAVESALKDCTSDDLEDFQNEVAAALDALQDSEFFAS